jgi:hypothetical protein
MFEFHLLILSLFYKIMGFVAQKEKRIPSIITMNNKCILSIQTTNGLNYAIKQT